MRKLRFVTSLSLLFCMLLFVAFAQKATGEIHRTVFDPSHTPVPKAQISITDSATDITKMINSGSDGSYRVPNLLDVLGSGGRRWSDYRHAIHLEARRRK